MARECSQKKGDDDKGGQAGNSASKKKLHGEGLVSEALTSASSERMKDASWVLDSGASDHMSNRRNWFITYEAFDSPTAALLTVSDKKEQGPPGPFTFPDSLRESNINEVMVDRILESSSLGEFSYNVSLSACDMSSGCDGNLTSNKDNLIKNATEENLPL
ncbi:unnamed protein product [Lasius platythorax]|uniref:Gag-pol polyprotein n=2 Tax=Lasius TaxID=488720 RepID=A0A0J7KUC6_LASNI|nr:gag-pol polyprotein [Lasius niger]